MEPLRRARRAAIGAGLLIAGVLLAAVLGHVLSILYVEILAFLHAGTARGEIAVPVAALCALAAGLALKKRALWPFSLGLGAGAVFWGALWYSVLDGLTLDQM